MRRKRHVYSAKERSVIWDHYKQGDSLHDIAKMFNRHHPSISREIYLYGGIRPIDRKRSSWALTYEDREEISRGLVAGMSMRAISTQLNRAPSTISREIERNGGTIKYRAVKADKLAWARAKRPKVCKLITQPKLAKLVAKKLQIQWSPQQISGWLSRTYPGDEELNVSHEAIYKTLYVQSRGALKKELQQCLRSHRVVRRSRKSSLKGKGLGQIPNIIKISERPPSVEDRAIPGHWEGDLIQGSNFTYIATLVERHSKYVMLVKVPDSKSVTVVNALIKHSKKLPEELYKSLTWDRGKEMTEHQRFTIATDIQVYFCDPQSPWQRGSNGVFQASCRLS